MSQNGSDSNIETVHLIHFTHTDKTILQLSSENGGILTVHVSKFIGETDLSLGAHNTEVRDSE